MFVCDVYDMELKLRTTWALLMALGTIVFRQWRHNPECEDMKKRRDSGIKMPLENGSDVVVCE